MNTHQYIVRDAAPSEFAEIGKLMVNVYSQLEGFPNQDEQPDYYKMLANIGNLTKNPKIRLLTTSAPNRKIAGGVVYISDMKFYGSAGTATTEKQASGFRLLAVDPDEQGKGVGKLLINACIQLAKEEKQKQLIIHSTKAMQIAWKMYEKMGFERSEDLDFMQEKLPVFGFRLML